MLNTFRLLFISICSVGVVSAKAQDTVKCYVQIMVPASETVGLSKEIEDNRVFLNGGIFLYTKAYAIKDTTGKYVKFLTPRKKELKNIWSPDDKPVVMRKEW
jgi:hypothetical protein